MTQLADEQQAVVDAPVAAEPVTSAEMYADDTPTEPAEQVDAEPRNIEPAEGEGGDLQANEPSVTPPASWGEDAKDVFAQIPPELQKVIADRERERERFAHSKAQEVVTVRREAEQAVAQQVAQQTRAAAEQLRSYAAMFDMQPPDPRLLSTGNEQDRAYYYQQDAAYRQFSAQRDQAQQQASEAQRQAEAMEQQILQQELQQDAAALLEAIPEARDPEVFAKLQAELAPIGTALGYPPELLREARAADFVALRTAAEWKKSHDKLQAMNRSKMIPVRAAKSQVRPLVPGTPSGGQPSAGDIAAQLYPDDVRK